MRDFQLEIIMFVILEKEEELIDLSFQMSQVCYDLSVYFAITAPFGSVWIMKIANIG